MNLKKKNSYIFGKNRIDQSIIVIHICLREHNPPHPPQNTHDKREGIEDMRFHKHKQKENGREGA